MVDMYLNVCMTFTTSSKKRAEKTLISQVMRRLEKMKRRDTYSYEQIENSISPDENVEQSQTMENDKI